MLLSYFYAKYLLKNHPDKQFSVKVSYLEIYKEDLQDLLDQTDKELHIREDEAGNISKLF